MRSALLNGSATVGMSCSEHPYN